MGVASSCSSAPGKGYSLCIVAHFYHFQKGLIFCLLAFFFTARFCKKVSNLLVESFLACPFFF